MKTGDKIVCIHTGPWWVEILPGMWLPRNTGPRKDQDFIVQNTKQEEGKQYILINDYPSDWWDAQAFRKIDLDFANELLKDIKPEPHAV